MRHGTALKRKKHSLYVKRRNKKVKSAVLAVFSLILLGIFFTLKSLIAPAASALSPKSNNLIDKDIYSVLFVEKDSNSVLKTINLLIVQKTDNKLYSLSIPPYTKVDLAGRLGEEELGKTLVLRDSELLVQAVKKLLNMNVDRYTIASSDSFDALQGAVFNKDLRIFLPWEFNKISGQTQTDLKHSEMFDFISFSRSLDPHDVISLDLKSIADLDLKIRDITLSGKVANESLGVVILNGTGVSNVAKAVSDMCQNIGARVTFTANAENEYQKSYLVTDDPLSPTVTYIKSYYPKLNVIDTKSASSFGEDMLERGDAAIIIGFDIQEEM